LDLLEPLIESNLPTACLERQKPVATEVKAAIMAEAVKSFEEKKKQFGSSSEKAAGKPMRIRVPGLQRKLRTSKSSLSSDHIEIPRYSVSLYNSAAESCLLRPREDIIGLFEKIVVEVISMLRQQTTAFNKRYRRKKIDVSLRSVSTARTFIIPSASSSWVVSAAVNTFLTG